MNRLLIQREKNMNNTVKNEIKNKTKLKEQLRLKQRELLHENSKTR